MTSDSIAIVGGSGFVGSSIAEHLSSKFRVTVIDRAPPQGPERSYIPCDIRDRESLIEALRGFCLIINTAIIQVPEINEKQNLGYEVNVLGVQNLCEAVRSINSIKGLVHAGSWHVFGEKGLRGILDEEFGFRPDKIEERAKFYAMCKIAQEALIRISAETSGKSYGIIRLGTVLGERMPRLTAANIFIDQALGGEPITPFKQTQYRPMLYVDIQDVCRAFESFANLILKGGSPEHKSRTDIVNLVYEYPITVIELARMVRTKIIRVTHGKIKPKIRVIDNGIKQIFSLEDKKLFRVDNSKAREFLGLNELANPQQSIERIIRNRIRLPG